MSTIPRLIRKLVPNRLQGTIKLPVHNVTETATEFDLDAMDILKTAPVWMTRAERLLVYTMVFTLRPSRYLEIGTLKGGSALIVNAAMNALKSDGKLVCLDPKPQIAPEHMEILKPRTTVITGYSPQDLGKAQDAAGGPFDLVLIDGDHSYNGLMRDANGVLPHVADGAYLLFHDSLFTEVSRGLHDFANQHTNILTDFGTMTREVTYQQRDDGSQLQWGGIRMMQVRRNYQVD
ncbi:MAG: class I SAM-dependent methyltransferase [Chloroflexota bacterium]